jgi:hypothetical protein
LAADSDTEQPSIFEIPINAAEAINEIMSPGDPTRSRELGPMNRLSEYVGIPD